MERCNFRGSIVGAVVRAAASTKLNAIWTLRVSPRMRPVADSIYTDHDHPEYLQNKLRSLESLCTSHQTKAQRLNQEEHPIE